jgi:ADP-ribose pyrophosphatase YjhB (NUDIX family)
MPHIHELVDFTVSIYIVNDGAVLLRFHEKYKFLIPVGGHVELNEDINEAAVREAKEESGLDVELIGPKPHGFTEGGKYKQLVPPAFVNIHAINDVHRHHDFIYFARANSRVVMQTEVPSEHIRWVTEAELESPELALSEVVKHYARSALGAH